MTNRNHGDRSWIEILQDPVLVWRFQQYFGVQKVKEVTRGPTWVALESKLMPTPLPDKVKIKTSPEILPEYVEDEHRYDLRVRAVKKDQFQDEDASVCSSGYSSEAESEEASIVYYKIGSEIWHLVFLLGSQLGDETFYALFFAFWFWNIDGAVGRRVMLVWMLAMYIGQVTDRG
ncbi:uncharacterized protein LOC111717403 isoform X2 [Eurytemora carolleeae]|uniref:uncharacterized protein LOC111717403 isoform X2 n=1 Tax=Eurytemora carolleeae TaxID=1294199 RepID=UPI000C77957B|nr:uncharacterized protein LOC111717403 isoform X2 [Eurytemora carolleeae]|eukprot:XP_023348671.1 uncharacterized protein LOC111717403 isoform X2 [Eurytemora affinis]